MQCNCLLDVKTMNNNSYYCIIMIDYENSISPVLPKSRHTLKMMVSGLFVEFEITVNHIYDIILNNVTMRT